MRKRLEAYFDRKIWNKVQTESRSGAGSTLQATERVRKLLPALLKKNTVTTFLDAPCGDWNWMSKVDLIGIEYIGADISSAVVAEVKKVHGGQGRQFLHLDITDDSLPEADLMMCRDCLFHLNFRLRWAFLENFARSTIPLLLTTVHHVPSNEDLDRPIGFKKFNPLRAPFNFPEPVDWLHETADALPNDIADRKGGPRHRSLGLWTRQQILGVIEARASETGAAS